MMFFLSKIQYFLSFFGKKSDEREIISRILFWSECKNSLSKRNYEQILLLEPKWESCKSLGLIIFDLLFEIHFLKLRWIVEREYEILNDKKQMIIIMVWGFTTFSMDTRFKLQDFFFFIFTKKKIFIYQIEILEYEKI